MADYITSVVVGGDGTQADMYLRYYIEIDGKGVIMVTDPVKKEETIEATCGYSAAMTATSDLTLDSASTYRIKNVGGRIDVNLAP
jgi:hypothetical protein